MRGGCSGSEVGVEMRASHAECLPADVQAGVQRACKFHGVVCKERASPIENREYLWLDHYESLMSYEETFTS